MSLVVYGMSFRTAPLERMERMAIAVEEMPKALQRLTAMSSILEGAILSTCNRVEIYANVTRFHAGVADIKHFIEDSCRVDQAELAESAYLLFEEAALRHLFRVASGLDSMVLGESEILGQVRKAISNARGAGSSGRVLGRAFDKAIEVGKRVRSQTAISANAASVSSAAVQLASLKLGGLEGRRVAVVGAGEAGQAAARALAVAGCAKIYVMARRPEAAAAVAERVGGEVVSFDKLAEVVDDVEILVTSTRSPGLVLGYDDVQSLAQNRNSAPLLIVDIAVPRDVDPAAREIEGVEILDIEDLEAVAEQGRRQRAKEAEAAERIVNEELEAFLIELKAEEYRHVIAELSSRFDEILQAELDKVSRKRGVDSSQVEFARKVSRAVVKKILHLPVSRLKEAATSEKADKLAEALAYLFELDPKVPEE